MLKGTQAQEILYVEGCRHAPVRGWQKDLDPVGLVAHNSRSLICTELAHARLGARSPSAATSLTSLTFSSKFLKVSGFDTA